MIESGTLLQGRFLVDERIGEGGMGAVYRATDQKFGSTVAIKETFYGDAELGEAFEREARLLNGLHHPIFPHVSDFFTENDQHFLVMEFIEGEDMSAMLKRGEVFAVEEVMRWTMDLLDGLDYLHSQDPPVIHRDIKPNNLKVTSRGNIVLLDFGMAKETSGNTLGMRSVFGYSRRYSPLEQIEGTGTDPRSDIFALGATVFHILTGKPPIDVLARASAIVAGRPDPLQLANTFRSDVPESVAAIIHSAMALNPDERFVSARAMWSALEYALGLDFTDEPNSTGADIVPIAAASSVFVPDPEFPALEAYKAEFQETPATAAAEGPLPAPGRAEELHEAKAQELAGADNAPNPAAATDDDGRVIDRAVIHLGTVDLEDDIPDAPVPGDSSEPEVVEPLVVPPYAATDHARQTQHLSQLPRGTGVVLIAAAMLLAAVVGVYTLMSGSAAAPESENATVANATSEPAAETMPANLPSVPATDNSQAQPDANEIASAVNDGSVDEAAPEGEVDALAETGTVQKNNKAARPAPQDIRTQNVEQPVETGNAGSEERAPEPRVAKQTPQQARRQRSGAERPRIVPGGDEPSAVTIETVLTGVPYERRRRGDDEIWMDKKEEKEFLRRLRRLRKQERRGYPPF